MFVSRFKILILVFLLSWVGAQSLALDHEFSEEHNQSAGQHICHAQVLDKDDFIIPTSSVSVLTIEIGLSNPNLIPSLFKALQSPPFSARAPPSIS